ncbi:ATP synthase subunit alpha [Striga asiatica]|uniref:ATP synthase subunit alpha n=1 Tax=Striga asiatica TaxID=4170 RepID=A0A5A7PCI8_STRAF|nr:ATP synthase subunit alpha [Striga asiatica]
MAAGLQSGWAAFRRAARPLTWGQDMEVPEIMLKPTRRMSSVRPVGPIRPDHPARMFTPGAIRSGFRISGVMELGPRELKAATTGDGWIPTLVPSKEIVAVGLGSDERYSLMKLPEVSPTAVAGIKWASATSSSPLAAVLARTIPAPPADLTTAPFWTLGVEGSGHAEVAVRGVGGVPGVDEGEELAGEWGDAGEVLTVPEGDVGREVAVEGAGADGGYPRRHVGEAVRAGPGVAGRAGDEDAPLDGGEGADGHAVPGEGQHVDAVGHGPVQSRQDVRAEAAAGPADFVNRQPGPGGHPAGRPCGEPEQAGVSYDRSGGRRGGVGPVAVAVERRFGLLGLVDGAQRGLIASREISGSDQLPVAARFREVGSRLAVAPPGGRDRPEARIVEARAFGPDPGVEDADDDLAGRFGLREDGGVLVQAHEGRGPGGVELVPHLREDGEDAGPGLHSSGLLRCEPGGEAVDHVGVGVDHLGRTGDRLERRVVPVDVVVEGRRHLGFSHVNYVSFLLRRGNM